MSLNIVLIKFKLQLAYYSSWSELILWQERNRFTGYKIVWSLKGYPIEYL